MGHRGAGVPGAPQEASPEVLRARVATFPDSRLLRLDLHGGLAWWPTVRGVRQGSDAQGTVQACRVCSFVSKAPSLAQRAFFSLFIAGRLCTTFLAGLGLSAVSQLACGAVWSTCRRPRPRSSAVALIRR